MTTNGRNYILNHDQAQQKLRRMALEIIENNHDESELIIAGIQDNGTVVARAIQRMIGEMSSIKTRLITITLDKRHPGEIVLSENPGFNDKVIILVDDVANSGRTMMYALKPFLEFHPKKIQSLVLVERSHNTFPIQSDYSGLSIATTLQDHIYVEVEDETVKGAYME